MARMKWRLQWPQTEGLTGVDASAESHAMVIGGRRVTVEWRPDDSNAGIYGRKDLI